MALKQNPQATTRPASPPKHQITTLHGIPEATPGLNAFAQRAARAERHRFEGNAFYQQEVQKRKMTPPNAIHPALREASNFSMPTSNSGFLAVPGGLMISATQDPRESTVTTMSRFINAERSPPLHLVPGNEQFAEPTRRGVIEERREQMVHEASGSDEERVPVYQTYAPTPKPLSQEFVNSRPTDRTSTPRKPRLSLPKKDLIASDAPKSPKKSLFEKLRMTRSSASASPSMTALHTYGPVEETQIPVKAQAVLGASPSKTSITRSPSKQKKTLFGSRRSREPPLDVNTDGFRSRTSTSTASGEALRTASTQGQTPQTAFSDPSHYSHVNGKRIPSQTLSDRAGSITEHEAHKCIIQRSQSLKYLDNKAPPTPPAKNTPPDQKALRGAGMEIVSRSSLYQQDQPTPSRAPPGILTTNDRLSPTKFGNYAHKEQPQLVTKPSVYSLHASVVPEMMETTRFEEIKARFEGLALEGFDMPEETHQRSPEMAYSPSIYSVADFGAERITSAVKSPRAGGRYSMGALPTLTETPSERDRSIQTFHRTKKSSSSGGSRRTIPVMYPELASDPSMSSLMTPVNERPTSPFSIARSKITPDMPMHGHTHSRDHSNSPRHSVSDSADISLFARPLHDAQDLHASSASFNHPSAMPSPLHYLPATVYTPSAKLVRSRQDGRMTEQHDTPSRGSGLGISTKDHTPTSSPTRSDNLFDTAPILSAQPALRRTASRRQSLTAQAEEPLIDVDPQKPSTLGADKQEQMLALLQNLVSRNNDVAALREELRAANERLDQRLAVMEGMARSPSASPNSSAIGLCYDGTPANTDESDSLGRSQYRVATGDAHEFYRLGQAQNVAAAASHDMEDLLSGVTAVSADNDEDKEEKIARLEATNKQLTALVSGFAGQLEEIKRRVADH